MKKRTLALKLRAHRKQKGLTQEEMAELIGVDKANVRRWEASIDDPDQNDIESIAKVLGVPPDMFKNDLRVGESRVKKSIKYTFASYIIIFALIIFIRTFKENGRYEDILSRDVPEIFRIVGVTFFQNIFIALLPAVIIGLVFHFYIFPREHKK